MASRDMGLLTLRVDSISRSSSFQSIVFMCSMGGTFAAWGSPSAAGSVGYLPDRRQERACAVVEIAQVLQRHKRSHERIEDPSLSDQRFVVMAISRSIPGLLLFCCG
jgi:hypothetical protein